MMWAAVLWLFLVPRSEEVRLRLAEADAVVELHEVRLYNVKVRAEQDDLRLENARSRYLRAEVLLAKGGCSEQYYNDVRLEYRLLRLQTKVKDVEEAEAELKIMKARREMIRHGVWPSPRRD